jgi:2-iminobutanoate/2-iminopropanoate deaminase
VALDKCFTLSTTIQYPRDHERNYVRDPANVARYNELCRDFFTAPYPARTRVANCLPEVLHFEIGCIAVPK